MGRPVLFIEEAGRAIEAVVQQAGLRLDLIGQGARALPRPVDEFQHRPIEAVDILGAVAATGIALIAISEERRVGKEWVCTCRCGWWPYQSKKTRKRSRRKNNKT